MKPTAVRRTVLAASAAALALLATACGGSGDETKGDEGKGKADSSASAAPATKALTAAELEKAALAQADVEDGKVATKLPATDDLAADKVKAEDAACQPLAYALSAVPAGSPAATVKRSWTGEPKKPAGDTSPEEALLAGLDMEKVLIALASYEDGGAEQVVKDVDAAVGKCAGGFAFTAAGEKLQILKAEKTEAPGGADEALAITATLAADEDIKAPMKVVVARKGATVVTFAAVNLASAATGADFDFPAKISDAQLAKLG
ncbi:lipoprotein [Streptomyces prasinosporus]|uniref:Lipoprotein n=1 Tax=Streptomyces prasinosporus TaxID=68256 RepID=A0ABP6TWT6_9ACTN